MTVSTWVSMQNQGVAKFSLNSKSLILSAVSDTKVHVVYTCTCTYIHVHVHVEMSVVVIHVRM